MVVLYNDNEEAVKQQTARMAALKTARDARIAEYRKNFEAIERGRHPRSFPNSGGVWSLVRKSRERLTAVQSGASLYRVVGVDDVAAKDIHKSNMYRRLSNEISRCAIVGGSSFSTGPIGALSKTSDFVSRLVKDEETQSLSSSDNDRSSSDDRAGCLRQMSEHNSLKLLNVSDPVALAKSYISQYQNNEMRTQKAARRLSNYRHIANSSFNGLQTITGKSSPKLARRNTSKHLFATDSIAEGKGNRKCLRGGHKSKPTTTSGEKNSDKIVDVSSFLASARQQGHHRNNDSVIRYIKYCEIQESRTPMSCGDTGSNNSHNYNYSHNNRNNNNHNSSSSTTSTPTSKSHLSKSKRNLKASDSGNESLPPGDESRSPVSLDELQSHNSEDSNVELIEFAPPNAPGKLFYGSQVALEYHDGSFLTVSEANGAVSLMRHPRSTNEGAGGPSFTSTNPLDPLVLSSSSLILFTLVNLNDPEYVGPICSDDDVWLCIRPGHGQFTWKEGSILGSRVTGSSHMETVPIDKTGRIKTYAQEKKDLRNLRLNILSQDGLKVRSESDKHHQIVTPPRTQSTDNQHPLSPHALQSSSSPHSPNNTQISSSLIDKGKKKYDSTQQSSERIGSVLPIPAFIPKLPGHAGSNAERNLDDLYRDATNIQRIQKLNRTASHLGQWKIRAASNSQVREFATKHNHSSELSGNGDLSTPVGVVQPCMPITNNMPISLEQDWVYLAVDDKANGGGSDPGSASASGGAVPEKSSGNAKARSAGNRTVHGTNVTVAQAASIRTLDAVLKKIPRDNAARRAQYRVERQAVFHIRLVQPKLQVSTNNSKSVEQTLLRAHMQLKNSEETRLGNKQYQQGLASGKKFIAQIRKIRHDMDTNADTKYLEPIQQLELSKSSYFLKRYQSMMVGSNINVADIEKKEPIKSVGKKNKEMLLDLGRGDNAIPPSTLFGENKKMVGDNNIDTLRTKYESVEKLTPRGSQSFKWGTSSKNNSPNAQQIAKKFLKRMQHSYQKQRPARHTEAYIKRLKEDTVAPWFETVYQLQEADSVLIDELNPQDTDKTNCKLKATALRLLKPFRSAKALAHSEQSKIEMEECLTMPIYHRLLKEDKRIVEFQAKQQQQQLTR